MKHSEKRSEEHKEKIRQAHLARKADLMRAVCDMATAGKATKEIASHFGKSVNNINRILRKYGPGTVSDKITAICNMARNGKSTREICTFFGELPPIHQRGFARSRHQAGSAA